MASLPFAPYLRETGIIKAPVSKVWPVVSKIQAWMPIHRSLSKAEKVLDDAGEPTDFVRWHLGEGHEILCKIEAIDVSFFVVIIEDRHMLWRLADRVRTSTTWSNSALPGPSCPWNTWECAPRSVAHPSLMASLRGTRSSPWMESTPPTVILVCVIALFVWKGM